MIAVRLPFFFLAMYEKDGQPQSKPVRAHFYGTFFPGNIGKESFVTVANLV